MCGAWDVTGASWGPGLTLEPREGGCPEGLLKKAPEKLNTAPQKTSP